METERDRLQRIIENMARGKDTANKLRFDNRTKSLRPVSASTGPMDRSGEIDITPEDMKLSGN